MKGRLMKNLAIRRVHCQAVDFALSFVGLARVPITRDELYRNYQIHQLQRQIDKLKAFVTRYRMEFAPIIAILKGWDVKP